METETKTQLIPHDAPGVVLTWELKGDHWMDWKAYLVTAHGEDEHGEFTVPLFEQDRAVSSMDTTANVTEAEVFAEGFLKWDGCFQFTFPNHIHFDGEQDTKAAFDEMVTRVFATAREHMPAFDAELAR